MTGERSAGCGAAGEEVGGLTKGERRAYLALAELGPSTANPVVRKTGMQKSTVYFCLERLVAKGLVGYVVKNNRRVFEAAPSNKLAEFFDVRRKRLEEQKGEIEKTVKALLAAHPREAMGAKVFEGFGGVETLFEDILNTLKKGDEYLVLLASPELEVRGRFRRFMKRFHEKRWRKGIPASILIDPVLSETVGKDRAAEPLTQVREQPFGHATPVGYGIYGNKVGFAIWTKEPVAILLEGKELADAFRKYFKQLWEEETRIYHGLDGMKALIDSYLEFDQARFIGGRGQVAVRMPEYFWKEFAPRAEARGLKWRILGLPEIVKTPIMKAKFVEVRLVPELSIGPTVIGISGNRVMNTIWKKEPVVFVLENKKAADGYKQYFEWLWKQAKPVSRT